jgi:hypothetical protein
LFPANFSLLIPPPSFIEHYITDVPNSGIKGIFARWLWNSDLTGCDFTGAKLTRDKTKFIDSKTDNIKGVDQEVLDQMNYKAQKIIISDESKAILLE